MTSRSSSAEPLKIGLLHQYRLDTSGSGVYLRLLAGHLLGRGHSVSLMSHDPSPAFHGASVAAAGGRGGPVAYKSHALRGAGTPVAYPRAEEPDSVLFRDLPDPELARYLTYHVNRVTRIVERERLDVLHANSEVPMSYVAALVSRRTGVPYVTVAHGSTLEYMYRVDPRYRRLCHIGLRGASKIVVLNKDLRDRMLAVAPEVADKLRVVPPGVDCSTFRPLATAGSGPVLALRRPDRHRQGCIPPGRMLPADLRTGAGGAAGRRRGRLGKATAGAAQHCVVMS